jgi:calcineurin-like phosphoesterase family protein
MWLTSDTHLGHINIIKYCNRPFVSVESMNAALIDAWNDRVRPNDEVWHLGDLAMGLLTESLDVQARRLHGRKFLVAGNHDRCWTGKKKVGDWPARYLQAGFTPLPNQTSLRVNDKDVEVCHFPYVGDSQDEDRYEEHRPVDRGSWLLHGHVHDSWQQRDKMINVGVDVWDFAPVHIDTLAAIISGREGLA